jgi:hypothetical protein
MKSSWEALEWTQSNIGTLARHSTRQKYQKKMERKKLQAQRD